MFTCESCDKQQPEWGKLCDRCHTIVCYSCWHQWEDIDYACGTYTPLCEKCWKEEQE